MNHRPRHHRPSIRGTADQTTVKVTWTAPDTELIVTAYTVRWRSASDTEWTEVENIQSTDGAYTISDLQPATEYEVQVRAVFETGDGAWSESVTVTTTEAASDPMSDPMTVAPPMVETGTPGRTTVTITWTAPETDLPGTDLVITGFTVRWREPSDTAWTEADVPSTETTYTIRGLQSGTEYEVQVRAVFGSGDGAWSPAATVQTEPGSVTPRPPRRIYWVEASGEAIKRANLDGTGVETLVQTGSGSDPAGIALTASKMYWTDYGTDTIKRANLDGTGVETLVDSGLAAPSGIAVDGGKMYWADFGNDTIKRANLDGSVVEVLVRPWLHCAGGRQDVLDRTRARPRQGREPGRVEPVESVQRTRRPAGHRHRRGTDLLDGDRQQRHGQERAAGRCI